jgi:hypothetical protein
MKKEFFISRQTLEEEGYCAPATVRSVALAFGFNNYSLKDMKKHISNPAWGTKPTEIVDMFSDILPKKYILAKENWTFNELEEVVNCPEKVGIVVDITDKLKRFSKTDGKFVSEDIVDGHYVIVSAIVNINDTKYALIIDGSKDEIVQKGEGLILTNYENIYFVKQCLFESMWSDENFDGSKNFHWACVAVHPADNPLVLEKYSK